MGVSKSVVTGVLIFMGFFIGFVTRPGMGAGEAEQHIVKLSPMGGDPLTYVIDDEKPEKKETKQKLAKKGSDSKAGKKKKDDAARKGIQKVDVNEEEESIRQNDEEKKQEILKMGDDVEATELAESPHSAEIPPPTEIEDWMWTGPPRSLIPKIPDFARVLEDAVLWDSGVITRGAPCRDNIGPEEKKKEHDVAVEESGQIVVDRPLSPALVGLNTNMPIRGKRKTPNSLGTMPALVVFCEHASVTYAVWMLDCLPRLVQLLEWADKNVDNAFRDPARCTPFVVPGEYFVTQWMIEMLHIPRQCIEINAHQLVWEWDHGPVCIGAQKMLHVPHPSTLPEGKYKNAAMADFAQIRSYVESLNKHVPKNWFDALSYTTDTNDADKQLVDTIKQKGKKYPKCHLIVFSERLDSTSPHNATDLTQNICNHLEAKGQCAVCVNVRLETLPVVKQYALMKHTDILLGSTGTNLLSAAFLSPKSLVIELFGLQSNSSDLTPNFVFDYSVFTYHMYWVDEGYLAKYQQKDLQRKNSQIQVTARRTRTEVVALSAGVNYQRINSTTKVVLKRHPVFADSEIIAAVDSWSSTAKPDKASGLGKDLLHLSRRFAPCETLFGHKKSFRLLGQSKDTYFIPTYGWALKVANSAANHGGNRKSFGDWRQMEREMRLLRNFTEARITPAQALCFDPPRPMYVQQRYATQLGQQGQTHAVAMKSADHWHVAVAGYIDVWMAHREREGRFLFYCDAGPKNWAISRDQTRLQMYDMDATYILAPGTMCSDDRDCGCADAGPTCINHRCTSAGMLAKQTDLVRRWVSNFILTMCPRELRQNPDVEKLREQVRAHLKCEDVVDYLHKNVNKTAGIHIPTCPKDAVLQKEPTDPDAKKKKKR